MQAVHRKVGTLFEPYERRWCRLEPNFAEDPVRNLLAESLDQARKFAGNVRNLMLLEIGAGMGNDALAFAQAGAIVFAIDTAPSSGRIIRNRIAALSPGLQVHPVRMDGQRLGFRPESFDIIFINSTLMHLDGATLFPELYRVLKPEGRVIFHEPSEGNFLIRAYRRFFSEFEGLKPRYFRLSQAKNPPSFFRATRVRDFFLASLFLMPIFSRLPRKNRMRRGYAAMVEWESRAIQNISWLKQQCWVIVAEWKKNPQ